ncbi:MAG: glycosyltransferase family 2 protein [Actinomycetota bacterium]
MTRDVAAIIPTHNRPGLALGAVRSALRQTYEGIDVWVVDDASDPPLRLPEPIASDERVHVMRCSKPVGTAGARNLAARESGAQFLAFLDDDDEWFPSKITRQLAVLSDDLAAVECGFDLREGDELIFRYLPSPERDFFRFLMVPCMQPSTLILRSHVFDELGGFSQDLVRTEDWDFSIRLAERYKVGVVSDSLVMRRTNPGLDRAAALTAHREMVNHLRPRVNALPARERKATLAYHRFVEGIFLAEMGNSSEARGAFWQALRADARAYAPAVHLIRTVVGERAWSSLRGRLRRIESAIQLRRGRDPLVRSW